MFVRIANRIAGVRRLLSFEWNGQPAVLSFNLDQLSPRAEWEIDVMAGGHPLRVTLNRLPDVSWVSPTLAGISVQSLPDELACALIEASFGEIFEALTKAGIDVQITAVRSVSDDSAFSESIEWCINRGADSGWMRGTVSGEDSALEHLANLLQQAKITPMVEDAQLPMSVSLVAGNMTLSLEELSRVEVHDVLLTDLSPYAKGKLCRLVSGRTSFGSGTLENMTFTLTQRNETPMSNATNALVNDLEVELTFVVGQSQLTVGQLRDLAPGFVFELNSGADDISICANGKPIGRGELLEVGEKIGVRVTSFSAP